MKISRTEFFRDMRGGAALVLAILDLQAFDHDMAIQRCGTLHSGRRLVSSGPWSPSAHLCHLH